MRGPLVVGPRCIALAAPVIVMALLETYTCKLSVGWQTFEALAYLAVKKFETRLLQPGKPFLCQFSHRHLTTY